MLATSLSYQSLSLCSTACPIMSCITTGSGERALSQLLLPFAWARKPLCERIPKLNKSIPIRFIYGDTDWMVRKTLSEPFPVKDWDDGLQRSHIT